MFDQQKMIIDEIQARQNDELSMTAAVEKVELIQQQEKNLSLYNLYKLLHKFNRNSHMKLNIR